uniref:cellulose-binding domain-containing protein n=1 Tax=Streptomyces lushanensis TaxID=1434255 RepID=UPI000AA9C931
MSRTTAPPRRARTALITASALIAAAAGTAIVLDGSASAAAAGCTVDYKIQTSWDSGFTANVGVTNTGDPVSSWKLEWSFAGNQKVTQGWNSTITQTGAAVSAANAAWNGALATGASASFGFNASATGTNAVPTVFKLNGVTCTVPGGGGPTTPPPTDPPTTPPPAGSKVDNPYAGAAVYVNPEWSAKAAAEPGGTRVSNQPTGVWLDRIAAIEGVGNGMGLRDHLDEALRQAAGRPLV